jgi:hypothetical protein
MTTIPKTRAPGTICYIAVGKGVQLAVAPTFHGFHPAWASGAFQLDFCNNVDDVVIRDGVTGTLYRVPINGDLFPLLRTLVRAMSEHDEQSGSPWREHNLEVRKRLLDAAWRRLSGDKPQSLNIFEPGVIAPALAGGKHAGYVDEALAALISSRGDTRIPGQ